MTPVLWLLRAMLWHTIPLLRLWSKCNTWFVEHARLSVLPYRMCTFRTCRFCGVHRGKRHKTSCTWHYIKNPIPDVLYGTDEDWDNFSEWGRS